METEEITCSHESLEEIPSASNMMIIDSSSVHSVSHVGVKLQNAMEGNYMVENTSNSLPITLVVAESPVMEHINENVNLGDSSQESSVLSAVNMQDGDTTTQFFIEHIAADGSQLQTSEGETIQIGVNHTATISNQDGVPILLHVTEDTTMDPQNNLQISQTTGDENIPISATLDAETIPNTMYTIHVNEEPASKDIITGEQVTTTKADLTDGDASSVQLDVPLSEETNLHFLATSSRLEDFMDVVTTYKCKFCKFSCGWKSGLMSHIRSCHLEASQNTANIIHEANSIQQISLAELKQDEEILNCINDPKDSVISKESENCSPDLDKSDNLNYENDEQDCSISELGTNPPPQERHIFLCGQCSQGFGSLEKCKQHMIKDHSLKLGPKKSRRRGRPPNRPVLNETDSFIHDDDDEDYETSAVVNDIDNNNYEENGRDDSDDGTELSKRKIRPPKALEEDYYLGSRKKQIKKESMADRSYRCIERGCGYRFSTEANLQYHGRSHSSEEKPFCCPECNEKSDHWRGLAIHLWKQHSIDIDLHTCAICGYKTYSLFKLDNHKRIHSEDREFICTTCGKGFKQLSQLRNHNVIHLDRKNMLEKRWYSEQECDICHRTFSDSKCLRKHQQAVHTKLKPYVCTYCGHMSARKAMLQLHMRQHTGEKPFACDHCDYRTGDHNSLRRHRMRHTGAKPYKCPHCPYACIQAISYKMHLKNKHPGMEGLYACRICTFRSVSKENYINHMSEHKRGAIPATSTSNFQVNNTSNSHSVLGDDDSSGQEVQEPAQLHVSEGTLQQLEGLLPENMSAAQLIYSCLNALNQDGGTVNLPAGITTTTTAGDGTQTITIQLPAPSSQEITEQEQFYLTIQHQDGSTPTTIIAPNIEIRDSQTTNDDNTPEGLAILQPIVTQDDDGQTIDSNFISSDIDSTAVVVTSSADLSSKADSASSLLQEVSPC